MKEVWLKCKEWWANLATRERQAAAFGGSFLAIFIVYQWTWTPYLENIAALRKQIGAGSALLQWMQKADKEIRKVENQAKSKHQPVSPVVFLGVIQKQINRAGLHDYLTQLKQATNDSIEMHFQKVEFDKLISLLTSIVKEQNVSITQMSAQAESTPGLVNADIILKLG